MVVLLMLGGCAARHGRPLLGGSTIPNPTGTMSGNVRTATGTPLEGRRVSAIDMATERHYDATTSSTGGYTIKVPTGKYRLEVELRGGEVIATQPKATDVNLGDVDEALDFAIGR
jgi:hypothetical protein